MAVNKNALIRYKTIDKYLQNRLRKWTLNALIEKCSDALYEYEGKDTSISKRTIQLDIQNMRSDKLGYNAPIIVVDKKYYTYENENYSITNLPISANDLEKLSESVAFLKQFNGFSHFNELNGIIQKLEDHIYTKQTNNNPIIDFEKNENLKGLQFLDIIYKMILNHNVIKITYKSFKARQEHSFLFNAYLLKEFRNRWFVIGSKQGQNDIMNLALDRIIAISESDIPYHYNTRFNLNEYFNKAIGVSINPNLETEKILLFIYKNHAPYVITKPLHASQKVIEKTLFGIIISLDIQHNYELEKEILSLGEGVKVIAPERLKRNVKDRLRYAFNSYQTELTTENLTNTIKQFRQKGAATVNQLYSLREIKKIHQALRFYERTNNLSIHTLTDLFTAIPLTKELVFNKNLQKVIAQIDKTATLVSSVYHRKYSKSILQKGWFQSKTKHQFKIIIYLKNNIEYDLAVILGSHKTILKPKEIDLLVKNSIAYTSQIQKGDIQLIQDNLLRKWDVSQKQFFDSIELTFKIELY